MGRHKARENERKVRKEDENKRGGKEVVKGGYGGQRTV